MTRTIHSADDQFKDAVSVVRERIRERQKTLVIILAVFLVILVGAGSFFVYTKYQKEKSAAFMQEGFKAYYGSIGQPRTQPAADRAAKALDSFKKAYDTHKSAAPLLYQGYVLYDMGKYDEAAKSLKELTDTFSDPRIAPLAYYKLSQAYLQKGDNAAALAALNDMARLNGGMQDFALVENARLLAMMGKAEDAKAKYEELLKVAPASPFAAEAKTKLGTK